MGDMAVRLRPTRLPSKRCIVLLSRLWGVMKSLRRGYSVSIWPGKCQRSYLALRAAVRERSKATVSTIGRHGCKCQHWPHEVPRLAGWGEEMCNGLLSLSSYRQRYT